jgi:acetyltransferase
MISLEGYEIIIGSSMDPQFGPVLLFGSGGQLVEVYKDRALGLPPLNGTLARRLMEQTKIYTALKGVRGRLPVDLAKLEELLVRFSYLVVEQRWISEIDINPLLASPERLLALDARVVIHPKGTPEDKLPKAGDPALSKSICFGMETKGRHPGYDPSDPAGGRTADGEIPRDLVRRERVLPLLQPIEARPAYRARAPHAHVLQRLRPRDRPGDRAARLTYRQRRDYRGWPFKQSPRIERRGIRADHQRSLPAQRSWDRVAETARADRRDEKLTRITASILAENHGMHHVSKNVGFKLRRNSNNQDYKAEIIL